MARKGGIRNKARLTFSKETYTPEGLKNLTDKELRKEYSRLRSIARKRLERFVGTEWTDSQVFRLNHGKYIPLKEIKTGRELRHLLTEVSRFVMSASGSVSGLEESRKKAIKSLNERGYDFIDTSNFKEFAEFMEYARVARQNRMFDSKRVADFYETAEERGLSAEEMKKVFRSWSRKQRRLKKIQNINPRNSRMYRNEDN